MFRPESDELQKEALKIHLETQMRHLFQSPIPFDNLIEILGAEEYVRIVTPRKNAEPYKQFDAKQYVEDKIDRGEKMVLPDSATFLKNDTILPPGPGEILPGNGSSELKEKDTILRTAYLIQLLSELNFKYSIIQGKNTPEMMRTKSYVVFLVPERRKAVFVNNEEGNATYIVHDIDEDGWEDYANQTKDQLKEPNNQTKVSFHSWPGDSLKWKQAIMEALQTDYVPGTTTEKTIGESSEQQDKEPAPDGWMTKNTIVVKLGKSNNWTVKRISALVAEHPEWASDEYLNDQKHAGFTHYSPQLIAELERMKREDEKHKPAPEGWTTLRSIAKRLSKSENWVGKQIIGILAEHAEWMSDEYLSEQGRSSLAHYSPQLIAELDRMKQAEGSDERAPEGWMTIGEIIKKISRPKSWVKKRCGIIVAEHPEWMSDDYLDNFNRSGSTHYSPELIIKLERIKQEEKENTVPEGWMTVFGIKKRLSKSQGWVESHIPPLVEEHPEWTTDEYLDEQGRSGYTHYSPQLIATLERIKDEEGEPTPEGWAAIGRIAKVLSKSENWVKSRILPLIAQHPEWASDDYLDSTGRNGFTHYSPELIVKLERMKQEEEGRVTVPEGWMTVFGITKRLSKSQGWVESHIPPLVEEHPEWMSDEYLDTRGRPNIRYYSPELIKELERMRNEGT